jgi:hypothetical protein
VHLALHPRLPRPAVRVLLHSGARVLPPVEGRRDGQPQQLRDHLRVQSRPERLPRVPKGKLARGRPALVPLSLDDVAGDVDRSIDPVADAVAGDGLQGWDGVAAVFAWK